MRATIYGKVDRTPRDLGAMRSTGISAFAYPGLVEALGLSPRLPRIHDTRQMIALPDLDVLDALGCDIVTIDQGVTNAFDEPAKWQEYDFSGRLPARVKDPSIFRVEPDETIVQKEIYRMPCNTYSFNAEHAGHPILDIDKPLPLMDLAQYRCEMQDAEIADEQTVETVDLCRRVRAATDKAVFMGDHFATRMSIFGHGGIGVFPLICMLEPAYVKEFHEITVEPVLHNIRKLLPEIKSYVDIILVGADDWGTQTSLVASPDVYRNLFLPYYKQINDEIHRIAPQVKTFIHTCGAVYDLLDLLVESGFDIINPIQWPAGGHSYKEWKDKLRRRATIWGGAVNSQHTLALGTVEDIRREATEVGRYMSQDGGFIFNSIHNILAEVPPEKILTLYQSAEDI